MSQVEELASYYYEVAPSSSLSYEEVKEDMTQLMQEHDFDAIYFSINYMSKFHNSELLSVLPSEWNWLEIYKYYVIASLKRSTEKGVVEYDSKNTSGADHKSAWFGKGIDSDLFE
ncbi:hypothetical protein 276BB001_39 [Bacillus phage 276BB001]|nr:hypothetical protein 276BB001_39 [Bacillus phage 276BB001]QFG05959.1 hypothetical protein 280BB001_39 [Bacillus phage 280BB001]QZA70108.1 hypothetical protein 274BB002_39 [Bacillus phage 274BB002]